MFRTESDTEVILAAWQAWGPDMLLRFNGMWALAICGQAPAMSFWPATASASSRCFIRFRTDAWSLPRRCAR